MTDSWGTNGPPLLWSRQVGVGYAAPSVRDGRLILFHRVGDREVVESMEAATGKTFWTNGLPTTYLDPYGYNSGPRCAPLLTTNRCFVFGAEGRLAALNLSDGKILWERDSAKDWEIPQAFFGVGSSLVLESGKLIAMVGGQPDSGVVALDPETGKTLWESVGAKNWQGVPMTAWAGERSVNWVRHEKQASYASPVAATIHGRRHLLCLMRQGLVSLNPTNGAVNFSFWFRATVNESVNAANPVVQDDQILISGAYYKVGSVLLRVNPDGKGVTEVWRNRSLEQHWNTPVLHEGSLYAFSGRNEPDAVLRRVEFATGKIIWDRDERWRGHQETSPTYGRGQFILADGKLIALGEGGLLGLFKVGTPQPEEIARAQIASMRYPCWAGPVLSGKRLYLRAEDRLTCLNLSK